MFQVELEKFKIDINTNETKVMRTDRLLWQEMRLKKLNVKAIDLTGLFLSIREPIWMRTHYKQ